MRNPTRRLLGIVTIVVGSAGIALAAPTCTDLPEAACGGRIVPEPRASATYLTYAEFNDALAALDQAFESVRVWSMGTSAGGRAIPIVEVTAPSSPVPYAQRRVVYLAQSIHGNEQAGREGMIRVVEDLARATDAETRSLLERLRVVQFVPNPDGWARGDLTAAGPSFTRGNARGVDLNRQFPWRGWIPATRTPLSEPEARAVVDDVRARRERGEIAAGSADIHGMSQDESAVWTMLSAGQFDLAGVARQVQLGEAIEAEVRARLGSHALFALGEAAGHAVRPHILTSSSEFQGGLSGSGFLGDWLAQPDGLDAPGVSTIEMFFNQQVNSATYPAEIVQIHVDGIRAIVRALMEQAVTTTTVSVALDGPVGYLHDPATVARTTPMRFFVDLAPFASHDIIALMSADLSRTELPTTVVVSTDLLTRTGAPAATAALRDHLRSGATVVLTDAALQLIPALTGLAPETVQKAATTIGDADFVDPAHPLAAGVRANALHTYEPAPLGYNSETATEAPVWTIESGAWENAGGEVVATTSAGVSIGELAVGDGTLRVIGGLLPPATTKNHHPYGLVHYTPVDTGYRVFINAVGGTLAVAAPEVAGSRQLRPPAACCTRPPLPATGAALPPALLGAVALAGAAFAARALRR